MKLTTTDFAESPSIDLFLFQNWMSVEEGNRIVKSESCYGSFLNGVAFIKIVILSYNLPFLKAKKSKTEWNRDTTMVIPKR